jgi:hypothetical protein
MAYLPVAREPGPNEVSMSAGATVSWLGAGWLAGQSRCSDDRSTEERAPFAKSSQTKETHRIRQAYAGEADGRRRRKGNSRPPMLDRERVM